MSDGSRGAFDWRWKPSGTLTSRNPRTRPPARASDSTSVVRSARTPRSWAPAGNADSSSRTSVAAAAFIQLSADGLQRDQVLQAFHLDVVPLHRRQVLVHEVPLPPFRRVRCLQPVA